MRFNKVILVNPYYPNSIFTMPVLPVGLGYITEFLMKNKVDCRVVDLMLGHRLNFLMRQIHDFQPDLIGFSMMSFRYKDVYRMAENIKKRFPDVKTVVGGPHISSCRENVLRECEAIDFGIVQEGEKTIEELCSEKEVDS